MGTTAFAYMLLSWALAFVQVKAAYIPTPAPAAIQKPCNNSTSFRFPTYAVTNWDVTHTYRGAAEFPVEIHVRAILNDTANEYSMNCVADQHVDSSTRSLGAMYASCAPDGGFTKEEEALRGSRPLAELIIMGTGFSSPVEEKGQISVQMQQTWYCGPKADDMHYYNVYSASAYEETSISCQERTGQAVRCTVPDLPGKAARMTFTARPNDFPQPLPRPSP